MPKLTKKLLGYCAVDSGQLIIVDPCYLGEWKDGEAFPKNKKKLNHYARSCKITLKPPFGGELVVAGTAGTGVVSITYDGDGSYPVYAMVNKYGQPTKLIVELT